MTDLKKYYLIQKSHMWTGCSIALILLLAYKFNDWARHLNWPPADQSNQALIKSLNLKCNEMNYGGFISKEQWEGKPEPDRKISFHPIEPYGIDRRAFIESPACMGVRLYLSYEGSGIREIYDIYDMYSKQKTAHIEITHEKYEHK
jgi:hypothetical protein